MSPKEPKDDWAAWKNHVLATLDRLEEAHPALHEKMDLIRTDISALKVKASVWGLLGGLIPAAGIIVVEILLSLLKGP